MFKYKLTKQNLTTHNGFQWTFNKTETINKSGGELCSDSFFHAYHDPLLAVFLNPIHANIDNPRLFRVKVNGRGKNGHGLKCGYKSMTLVEELELPVITETQKIAFGILCAIEVSNDDYFVSWAEKWLDGTDRSIESADSVASVAYHATKYSTYNVASAAYHAAYHAAYIAANAADYAADSNPKIDLIALAKKALTYS